MLLAIQRVGPHKMTRRIVIYENISKILWQMRINRFKLSKNKSQKLTLLKPRSNNWNLIKIELMLRLPSTGQACRLERSKPVDS
ncbi:hypothetical protein B9Z55_015712 [Caenorhabditis nigoni]|uniref:Uncharacterized protein n=1 Tax=Caenorhabditis nigoni TaxID=1611254 RepID=A0A2G5UC98_9PELO|nr:hypothetical protein B9Z55_015712 [Caenorhabditis nigoni]